MLDRFGKLVRDIRITRSILLYDMAKELDITPAELSAIECGRKPIPDWFIPALEKSYGIGETCASTLRFLAKDRSDNALVPKDKENSEGYSDPTAYAALRNLHQEKGRYRKLCSAILNICDSAGFEIRSPIVLADKKSGKVWR